MTVWLSGDFHLNHSRIIKFCGRPFVNVEEMNDTIIRNFNAKVGMDDIVYFLGDFALCSSPDEITQFRSRLNGNINFIIGNHDIGKTLPSRTMSATVRIHGKDIFLCHDPVDANPNFEICLVAHIHEKWKIQKRLGNKFLVNVGVDVWGFSPITFDDVLKEIDLSLKSDS